MFKEVYWILIAHNRWQLRFSWGCPQWPRCLRRESAAARLLGFRVRIPPGHGCLSLLSVLCFQVEVFALGWSLVHRNPTECGVSEYDHKASTVKWSWPTRGCRATKKTFLWGSWYASTWRAFLFLSVFFNFICVVVVTQNSNTAPSCTENRRQMGSCYNDRLHHIL
jgi:hypothetical protein